MRKSAAIGVLGTSALLIAGCAVPVPVQVASWALDGISFLVTEKSVSDHGLSIVAQKDCAVWRGVTEGELCRDWEGKPDTVLAAVAGAKGPEQPEPDPPVASGFAPTARSDIPPLATDLDEGLPSVEELANFDTAAGAPEPLNEVPSVTRPQTSLVARAAAPVHKPRARTVKAVKVALRQAPVIAPAIPKAYTQRTVAKVVSPPKPDLRVPVLRPAAATDEPAAGVYFVIGSFRNYLNARLLAGRHEGLVPEVLAAKLDGAPVYRVVVGPAAAGGERNLHRQVVKAGLSDVWAIRVTPGDWTIARSVIDRKRRMGIGSAEVARLSR